MKMKTAWTVTTLELTVRIVLE